MAIELKPVASSYSLLHQLYVLGLVLLEWLRRSLPSRSIPCYKCIFPVFLDAGSTQGVSPRPWSRWNWAAIHAQKTRAARTQGWVIVPCFPASLEHGQSTPWACSPECVATLVTEGVKYILFSNHLQLGSDFKPLKNDPCLDFYFSMRNARSEESVGISESDVI